MLEELVDACRMMGGWYFGIQAMLGDYKCGSRSKERVGYWTILREEET